jgi:hypothetical protein
LSLEPGEHATTNKKGKKTGGGGGISYYIEANIPEKNFWVSDKKQIQVSCGGEE